MLKKILFRSAVLRTMVLAAAVGGPIAYFSTPEDWSELYHQWFSSEKEAAAGSDGSDSPAESPQGVSVDPGAVGGVEGAPVHNLAEVLRFDVTPAWILWRWPRVSTGLAHLEFQGYRVPLVTGTAQSDLAGSLTYYFNRKQQLQRITFRGSTGDARTLVALLTARHKFTYRPTEDPGVFLYEAVSPAGQPSGVLRVTMAPVVKAKDPYRRFDVELEMERAS